MFVRPFVPRNPFKLTQTTERVRRFIKKFNGVPSISKIKPTKTFLEFWENDPSEAYGTFQLAFRDGRICNIRFNSKNGQFHALYLDRYAFGYEPEVCGALDALLLPHGAFYDIGANWGYFPLFVVSGGFQGDIITFEPNPRAHLDLQQIIKEAGVSSSVRSYECALSHFNGVGSMTLPHPLYSGLTTIQENTVGISVPCTRTEVNLQKLDDLVVANSLPFPDLMKIDAEDAEYDAIRGASNVIKSSRPIIIFENWADLGKYQQALDPLKMLEQYNYALFILGWRVPALGQIITSDNKALDLSLGKGHGVELALIPFRSHQRFLYGSKTNCIAVHPDKQALVEKSFTYLTD